MPVVLFICSLTQGRAPSIDVLTPGAQSHGRRTKHAVMLDADMRIPAVWRLRVTLQRVAQLCAAWDQHPLCFQAFQVPAILEGIKFFTIRVFPTAGAGTLDAGTTCTPSMRSAPAQSKPITGKAGMWMVGWCSPAQSPLKTLCGEAPCEIQMLQRHFSARSWERWLSAMSGYCFLMCWEVCAK